MQAQYAQYVVLDDIHINSKLTLGEDVADLGGEILAYMAWRTGKLGLSIGAHMAFNAAAVLSVVSLR